MRKPAYLIYAALAAAASWFGYQNLDVRGLEGLLTGLKQIKVAKKQTDDTHSVSAPNANVPVHQPGETIKIASFNIQVFGTSKLNKARVMDILARIVRQFDIVAIQEIRSKDDDIIPRFIELINSAGRHYDFVIGPRLGNTSSKEQYAFIFDRASIEVDRRFIYTVQDPDNLLHREPLVSWFRVRGAPPEQAFTFSLVNIHTDPDVAQAELSVMDDVFYIVRDDGRNEDDVIILGDLNADDRHLSELGRIPGITWCVSGIPTNVRQTSQYDNIVFHGQATREFVGRAGVLDFMREYNLSTEEALEVSDHMPVWAEFSIYEGGTPGYVASRPAR